MPADPLELVGVSAQIDNGEFVRSFESGSDLCAIRYGRLSCEPPIFAPRPPIRELSYTLRGRRLRRPCSNLPGVTWQSSVPPRSAPPSARRLTTTNRPACCPSFPPLRRALKQPFPIKPFCTNPTTSVPSQSFPSRPSSPSLIGPRIHPLIFQKHHTTFTPIPPACVRPSRRSGESWAAVVP